MHLDDNNEAKYLFIKTKKKTLEKPTARFVVRGGRGLGPAASQSSLWICIMCKNAISGLASLA